MRELLVRKEIEIKSPNSNHLKWNPNYERTKETQIHNVIKINYTMRTSSGT
jgi:hypothetical protein